MNPQNCVKRTHEELYLKGDVSWGAEEQFKNEALMAVRTANFISAFLQVRRRTLGCACRKGDLISPFFLVKVVDPKEVFPGTRVVDKPLTEDQMIGKC